MLGIDLHTHSHFSDGELSPQLLIERAKNAQIHTLALTDHDTIAGYQIGCAAAQTAGIRLISGVELSCQWVAQGRQGSQKSLPIHIVALNLHVFEPINRLLEIQQALRAERAYLIIDKLEKILKINLLDAVLMRVEYVADRITRSHIAQVLMQMGVVQRQQQAFDRYLGSGKSAYVPFNGIAVQDAIQVIHAAGAVAVLAHPTKYGLSSTKIRALIADFAAHQGDAIELPPLNETPATRHMIDRLIAAHQLNVSVGSDFHGSHMPWIKLGQVPALVHGQVGIWEQF